MSPTLTQPQPETRETHADLFTAAEAAAYLKLPSVRAFNDRRREHDVKGERFGFTWMYTRGQLDALKLMIFGEDAPARRAR